MLQVDGRCPGNWDQDGYLMGMGEALFFFIVFFSILCHENVKVTRNNLNTSEQWVTVSGCVTIFHSRHLPHKISSVMSLLLRQTQSFRCTFHSIEPGFAQLILQSSVHFRYRHRGNSAANQTSKSVWRFILTTLDLILTHKGRSFCCKSPSCLCTSWCSSSLWPLVWANQGYKQLPTESS